MFYGAEVAVCFEINTKQINTMWAECDWMELAQYRDRSRAIVGMVRNFRVP
jgi:hypothetical protein